MDTIWIAGRNSVDDFEVFGYFRSLEGATSAVEGNIKEAIADGYLDPGAFEALVLEKPSGAWLRWDGGYYVDRVTLKP